MSGIHNVQQTHYGRTYYHKYLIPLKRSCFVNPRRYFWKLSLQYWPCCRHDWHFFIPQPDSTADSNIDNTNARHDGQVLRTAVQHAEGVGKGRGTEDMAFHGFVLCALVQGISPTWKRNKSANTGRTTFSLVAPVHSHALAWAKEMTHSIIELEWHGKYLLRKTVCPGGTPENP